jgi:hypothetical protein
MDLSDTSLQVDGPPVYFTHIYIYIYIYIYSNKQLKNSFKFDHYLCTQNSIYFCTEICNSLKDRPKYVYFLEIDDIGANHNLHTESL